MRFITESFEKLDPVKQEKIINAALAEFIEHGYDNASTNRIVKKAGISKGMLFYYFNTKQQLFEYVIDYCIKFVAKEYIEKLDDTEGDFIKRYSKAAYTKMKAMEKNPYVFKFLGSIYIDKTWNVPAYLRERMEKSYESGREKLINNVDTSFFRDDVPSNLVYRLIKWSIDGYQQELIEEIKGKLLSEIDMKPYWDDFYEFLDVLKTIYYRQEEGKDGYPKDQ